jgi:HEPN domain-containing protein
LASQQAAEKALKAVCIIKGKGLLRVHELTMLARKSGAPKEVIEKCGLLNPFYTAARYPDSEEITDEESRESATKDAYESAVEVLEWCRKQIRT